MKKFSSYLLITAGFLLCHSVEATTRTWSDTDGLFWSNTAGWIGGIVPLNGDDVIMGTQSSAASNPVCNFLSIYTGAGLNSLKINATNVGVFTLSQTGGSSAMIATTEIIGDTVTGNVYTQNAGSNTTSSLTLGNGANSNGTYSISGSGSLSATNLTVGNAGSGTFTQSGGTVTVASGLAVSTSNVLSTSSYALSGGTLTIGSGGTLSIGATRGTFSESAGTVNFLGTSGLTLLNGSVAGNTNSYFLSGTGQITNASTETIGSSGAGSAATFTQNGGSNVFSAGGTLTVGNTGAGIYNLNSGTLTVASTIIGNSAGGTFTQAGGNWNGINVDIGAQAGSTGSYGFSAGSITLTGNLTVGELGSGTVTQSGGTLTTTGLNSKIIVGNGSSGIYNLSSTGQINADEIDIGAFAVGSFTGTFNQTGGTVTLSGNLVLGFAGGSISNYNLSAGTLNSRFESLGFSGGSTANFLQTGGTNSTLGLTIGVNSGSAASYTLNSGNLNIGTVANPGSLSVALITTGATMTENGGSVVIAGAGGSLSLGGNSGSSGTYLLKGGTLSAESDFVGQLGTGTFTQNGGTNTVTGTGAFGGLFVGYRGSGTYNLAGFGVQATLNATSEYIGAFSDGIFTQGLNTTNLVSNSVVVGANTGGTGTFNLNGGTLTTPNLAVGLAAPGVFNQGGGTATVLTALSVGGGSTGIYNLTAGALITPAGAPGFVVSPTGTFNQTGGSYDGYLLNQGLFVYSGGAFNGTLENAGNATVTLNTSLTAGGGVLNRGAINVPLGIVLGSGTNGLNQLDNENSLQMMGGALGGIAPIVNNGSIAGYGTIGGSGGFQNNGVVTTAGTLIINNAGTDQNFGTINGAAGSTLEIDVAFANSGTINLNGATLKGTGPLTNNLGGTLGGYGTITLNQFSNPGGTLLAQGGVLRLTNAFANAGTIDVVTGGTLAGAAVTNTGTVQGAGTISTALANMGTIEPVGGTLTVTGALTNLAAGIIDVAVGNKFVAANGLAVNAGTINLSGGTFDNNGAALSNTGSIVGFGTLRTGGFTNNGNVLFAGGSTSIAGSVTNAAGHTLEVRNNPAIFTGNVVNNGTFKTTNTTATFAGTFTNNGIFTSDPATQNFVNLTISSSGALLGGTGDVFNVTGDLRNHSDQAALFDLRLAQISVFNPGPHDLEWSGADLGNSWGGYANNFAIGTLRLGAGGVFNLLDGNNTPGGAFYVGLLQIDGGLAEIASIHGNGMNIYYDPLNAGNAYLNGGTYALVGGGFIEPVPEPGTVAAVVFGAFGLLVARHRIFRQRP